MQKTCSACGKTKPLREFHKDKTKKDGHTSTCKECAIARSRKWNTDNRERQQERSRRYYQENKERIKQTVRRYVENNRDKVLAAKRKYYKAHRKQLQEYRRQNKEHRREVWNRWYQANKEHVREYRKRYTQNHLHEARVYKSIRKARKNELPDTLTNEQWLRALSYFEGCCAVCGRPLNGLFHDPAADHWIPLSYEGDDNPGTVALNIVPLCHGEGGCNNSKHNKMPDEWLRQTFGKRKAKATLKRIEEYFSWVQSQDR